MKAQIRFLAGLAVLSALLALVGVLGARGGREPNEAPSPTPQTDSRPSGLIAYVTQDGQIRTIKPDGVGRRQVSPQDGFYTWPTWAPDGRSLLFSGIVGGRTASPRISLLAYDLESGRRHETYVGEPGVRGLLADGVIHYPLWSPDSSRVAFIAVTSQGLTLLVDDLEENVDADLVLGRGPLWMSWSPDSRYLLVHRHRDHFLVDLLADTRVQELGMQSLGYRVPGWDPSTSNATIISATRPGEYTLYAVQIRDNRIDLGERLARAEPEVAFLWSPNGESLAVAGSGRLVISQGLALLAYRELKIVSQDPSTSPLEIEENVIAFFWSPDGTKLAYVTLSDTPDILRWNVLEVAGGDRRPLVQFVPSHNQLVMFQFFDQYAYSHSLWAPDSRLLVFAGALSAGPVAASLGSSQGSQTSHIIVLGTEGDPSPQAIAEGILAVWSPR